MQHTKASVCGLKSFCSAAAEDDAFARLMEIMESRGKKYPSGIKSQGDRRNILVTFFTHMTRHGEYCTIGRRFLHPLFSVPIKRIQTAAFRLSR